MHIDKLPRVAPSLLQRKRSVQGSSLSVAEEYLMGRLNQLLDDPYKT
jgi:hypothetical protein